LCCFSPRSTTLHSLGSQQRTRIEDVDDEVTEVAASAITASIAVRSVGDHGRAERNPIGNAGRTHRWIARCPRECTWRRGAESPNVLWKRNGRRAFFRRALFASSLCKRADGGKRSSARIRGDIAGRFSAHRWWAFSPWPMHGAPLISTLRARAQERDRTIPGLDREAACGCFPTGLGFNLIA